jgi:hypothetical protein
MRPGYLKFPRGREHSAPFRVRRGFSKDLIRSDSCLDSWNNFFSFSDQTGSILIQLLDLASQQGRLFFMLRPWDNLHAGEKHEVVSDASHQIAQRPDAQNRARRRDV